MIRTLMGSRRFAPLFWCQFFAAFNDNVLKNALVLMILFKAGEAREGAGALVTLAGALFIAPFFILSGLGGQWADRYDKAVVAQRLKLAAIGAALFAAAGFAMASVPALFVALVMFGCLSALFGPLKYGILPDHLATEELPGGNALIEGATFLAILLGTIVGGLTAVESHGALTFGLLVGASALLSFGASRLIPRTGEGEPGLRLDANVVRSTAHLLHELWADRRLWRCGLYASWFWLVGAVVLSLLPTFVKDVLGGSETAVTALLAVFSVGVAFGSGLAAALLAGRVVLLPTPIAAVFLGAFALDLALLASGATPTPSASSIAGFFSRPASLRAGIDLFGLAAAGGLFIVPTFTAIQAWSAPARRARVIGAVNVLNAGFMVLGALVIAALQGIGFGMGTLFAIVGAANIVAAAIVLKTLPVSPFRDFLTLFFRCFYRLEVRGYENIAKGGPNPILALNHVSFLDAALALSLLDRDPVFAIDRTIAARWWVKPFLRLTRALPIDPAKPMATRALINAVRDGDTLVIFPEGRLTVTGNLMKVYDGAGLIADKAGVPVLPVRIEGLERTPFSYLTPAQIRLRWWPKLRVTILDPVHLAVDPALTGKRRRQAAGAALYSIMSDMVFRTTDAGMTIVEAVFEAARLYGRGRTAVEDPIAGALSYARLALGVRALGEKIAPLAGEGRAIGVMLPNSNGAAVTILAVMSAGRVPAMINFTAGQANILAACRVAEVGTVLTSRAFIEKAKLEGLVTAVGAAVKMVFLEDVRATIGPRDKLSALLRARRPIVQRRADDPAAILFTSGSEGVPKGVVLSHRNMLTNVAQVGARIDFGRTDKIFNVLPLFHAFGLTGGFVLPVVSGVPVYLYPSPLHYRIVPELVYGSNSTALFGTDTFLAGYARSANPYDFRSLRYVVAGAEPVKDATRRIYMEKFGLRILEGYGVTEAGPVLAVNTPMFNRYGTVGHLLPGIRSRLEPVSGVPEGGRLVVQGPNIMLGYLDAAHPGRIVPPPEGWYDTGDIVTLDADGFVAIKGRAKRFAKVGGEMVSLAAIEALAAECWPEALSAATAAPDPRKGERIVLVTEHADATRTAFSAFAKGRGAADIALPSEVVVVDHVPLLGSGKIDHPAVSRMVPERASSRIEAA